MKVLFFLFVTSLRFTLEAYALSSQAQQDKASLLINNLNIMQSDTIVEETSNVYNRKRRISNGSTGNFQEDIINSLRVAQHKSNALQEDAEKEKTVDTSVHQLRGGNSWKPELKSKSKSRHLTSSKAGAVMGSIGTVIGRRKLNSKIYLIQG